MDIYSGPNPILSKGNLNADMTVQGPGPEKIPKDVVSGEDNSAGVKAMNLEEIGTFLKELGMGDNPENRGLAILALSEELPLKGDTLSFFVSKRFKTSHFYRTIIQRGMEEGYPSEVTALKEACPRLETLISFLEAMDKNLELIHLRTLGLCSKLLKDESRPNIKRQLGEIYSGILLQMHNSLPFSMAQVPIMVHDQVYPSEIWMESEREAIYIEMTLPHLRTVGCLIKDWTGELLLSIYIRPEFLGMAEDKGPKLKDTIEDLGFKCGPVRFMNIEEESGILSFLGQFYGDRKTIDIRV